MHAGAEGEDDEDPETVETGLFSRSGSAAEGLQHWIVVGGGHGIGPVIGGGRGVSQVHNYTSKLPPWRQ